jgi:hypothetical protein
MLMFDIKWVTSQMGLETVPQNATNRSERQQITNAFSQAFDKTSQKCNTA